ncbi:ATPase PAAT [Melanerpes formicivorus]|uniref:ATPase PAAT n=1 Tax=Melanerpes formicivorus TaxID=211600 RepID=UPI00358FDC71
MASGCSAREAAAGPSGGPRELCCVAAECSWPCALPGGLARALCLQRDAGGGEASTEAVVVERRTGGGSEVPCVLQLECRPAGEMVSVGVLSEARNMEVYVGEEYCGTGRGQSRGAARAPGEGEKVTLYQKHLKFECPATSCRIKLLSLGEKQRVLISKITVQVRAVPAKPARDLASLGSGIDLDRVQTIMESMGSRLSPGAQQLMDMVRCQQKNSFPLGDRLSWILGKHSALGGDCTRDGLPSAAPQVSQDGAAGEPPPVRNHVTSETGSEGFRAGDLNTQLPERGKTSDSEGLPTQLSSQQNAVDLRNDLKALGSLELPRAANPQVLLPFLQSLCSQVSHLRLRDGDRQLPRAAVTTEDGMQQVGAEQQPICSYLERIISKNMDLMERKLMDYIDRQIQALQTHIDDKIVLLMDLLQNSKPNKVSEAHYDSSEGFSNGER